MPIDATTNPGPQNRKEKIMAKPVIKFSAVPYEIGRGRGLGGDRGRLNASSRTIANAIKARNRYGVAIERSNWIGTFR